MKKYLLNNVQNVYKANMHCHTTISDGTYSPEKIKDFYTSMGYSIVAFTDHNIYRPHQYLNDESFLSINALEVDINNSGPLPDRCACYHFNLYATSPDLKAPPLPSMDYHDTEAINQYIADRKKDGFLTCYNHPYWSLQTFEEYGKLKGCFAMEIYNHSSEVADGYNGYSPQAYDEMLRQGNRLYCFSTDDSHHMSDFFGGFIYVNSPSLSYEDVMASLINGDFYASQGPKIHEISLDGNTLTVKSSKVQTIVVYTMGRRCYIETGEDMEGANFELSGNEGYIRVMCRDRHKRDANSNAHWVV